MFSHSLVMKILWNFEEKKGCLSFYREINKLKFKKNEYTCIINTLYWFFLAILEWCRETAQKKCEPSSYEKYF